MGDWHLSLMRSQVKRFWHTIELSTFSIATLSVNVIQSKHLAAAVEEKTIHELFRNDKSPIRLSDELRDHMHDLLNHSQRFYFCLCLHGQYNTINSLNVLRSTRYRVSRRSLLCRSTTDLKILVGFISMLCRADCVLANMVESAQ